MKITFLTFNYKKAGKVPNGPGNCLFNFCEILKKKNIDYEVFSILKNESKEIHDFSHIEDIKLAIQRSDIVHHWSGISDEISHLCNHAHRRGKTVLIGPNVLDTVEFKKESEFLKKTEYTKIFAVNKHLRYKISKEHEIPIEKIGMLTVGPNLDIWRPIPITERNNQILWKGNSTQLVKGLEFALDLEDKLRGKYKFKFIGYPQVYDYEKHISDAKHCKLFVCTSLSETMGLALCEQLAAGIPAITHPKIYLPLRNYQCGIVCERSVPAYAEAIEEIMQNKDLYESLSRNAVERMHELFESDAILKNSGYVDFL